jgi:hypothetical protein
VDRRRIEQPNRNRRTEPTDRTEGQAMAARRLEILAAGRRLVRDDGIVNATVRGDGDGDGDATLIGNVDVTPWTWTWTWTWTWAWTWT